MTGIEKIFYVFLYAYVGLGFGYITKKIKVQIFGL